MEPLTCPGMSAKDGGRLDNAAFIHFNFLIEPKYLL